MSWGSGRERNCCPSATHRPPLSRFASPVWPSSKRVPQPPLGGPRRLVAAPIQNLPVAALPTAGCSKRTRRGHSACSTRFPVDAAERSRWVAVLTCFDRHTKPVQTGSRTAISQTYERRCSRPPDDDRRSVDDARGAGQHLYGCWRHRGEGGLGWERILRKTSRRARPWAGCDQAQVSW
jgi:hypothetical protein